MTNEPKVCIPHGNNKLGANIPSVSLPAIVSCIPKAPCAKLCYDARSYKRWPSVLKARLRNWGIFQTSRFNYFQQITDFLDKHKPQYFRWHVGGDIVDQEYLACMASIARHAPGTKFLAFTKRHDLWFINLPSNLTVVLSMWPGWGDPTTNPGMRRAWMQNGKETRIPQDAIPCPGKCEECGMCWALPKIGKDVVFNKH